jgi:uroporphyrinogen-III synthase
MWGEHLEMAARLALEMGEARSRALGGPRVLLTRPQEGSQRLAARLADLGIGAWVVPTISVELLEVVPDVLDGYDLVVVTSANAVRALAHQPGAVAGARWAAVGRTTARELRSLGATDVWMPSAASAAAVAQELPVAHGQRILRLRGELADSGVSDVLRARGAYVDELTVYRTVVAPDASRPLLDAALSGGAPAAVVLGSPSAVRGLLGLAPESQRPALLRAPAITLGPTTAAAARLAGFATVASAATPDPDAVAVLVAETLKREGA